MDTNDRTALLTLLAIFLTVCIFAASVGALQSVLLFFFALFIYFLPSFAAAGKKKRNAMAIFILNLLLGWTVIGWIVALVWAATNDAAVSARNTPISPA